MFRVLLEFCEEKCDECGEGGQERVGVVDHHPAHDCWGGGECGYKK